MHMIRLTGQPSTSLLGQSTWAQPNGQDVCMMLSGFLVFDAETGWEPQATKSVLLYGFLRYSGPYHDENNVSLSHSMVSLCTFSCSLALSQV